MNKYRLIEEVKTRNVTDDSKISHITYKIQCKYGFLGCAGKSWEDINIRDLYKTSHFMGFTSLEFETKNNALFVYDYIVEHGKLNDRCVDIILGNENIPEETKITVIKEN
jgi:hypothetical protein